ncbi:MAG: TcpQ domain-containing protein [Deltaproteobacteria bacterium]|jgi:hypothetical protein|nr:TcpQ domain-containing protein [Deltaproteobacteria bacterium]
MKKMLCLLLLLAGCAQETYPPAFDGVSRPHPEAVAYIASNAAKHLASIYPPGLTAIWLADVDTPFARAFENALRQKGFTIFPGGGLAIGYILDMLSDGSCYLSLRLPDDAVITQCYALNKGMVAAYPYFAKRGITDYREVSPVPVQRLEQELTLATPSARQQILPEKAFIEAEQRGLTYPLEERPQPAKKNPPASGTKAKAQIQTTPARPETPTGDALQSMSSWRIKPGSLKEQLEQWGKNAGYQVAWKARHDFDLSSSSTFQGDFVDAVQALILRLHEQGNPLQAKVYLGNQVLEISEE